MSSDETHSSISSPTENKKRKKFTKHPGKYRRNYIKKARVKGTVNVNWKDNIEPEIYFGLNKDCK